MLSNDLETKAKLDYKHKVANLRSTYLRKIRNELSGLNFDIPFITLIEAYYKKKNTNTIYKNEIYQFEQPINNSIDPLPNNNEQLLIKNISEENSSSKLISNDSSVFEKVIKNKDKDTKRYSFLNLINDSSTEDAESSNYKSKSRTINKKLSTSKSKNKKNQNKNKSTKNINLKINTIVEQKSFLSILSDSISFLKFNKSNK